MNTYTLEPLHMVVIPQEKRKYFTTSNWSDFFCSSAGLRSLTTNPELFFNVVGNEVTCQ